MKKIILSIISVACLLSLIACSNTKNNNDNQENNKSDIDLTDVYNSIISSQPRELREKLAFLPEVDDETIESFYPGLSNISLRQQEIHIPVEKGIAQEITLVEVEKSKEVKKVKDIFNQRIKRGIEEESGDSVWERGTTVQAKGNYVAMIALPDGYTIPGNVFED